MSITATGMEDQHGAVASAASRSRGSRCPGSGDWIRRSGHVPAVYCAGDAPDHEAAMPVSSRCERGARSVDVDLARNQGRSIGVVPRYRPGQDRGAGSGQLNSHRKPATVSMYRQIKSPLLRVFDNTSRCRIMPLPAGLCGSPRASAAAWYRPLPGCTATSEQTRSKHDPGRFRDRCAAAAPQVPIDSAWARRRSEYGR